METFSLVIAIAVVVYLLKSREQRRRIALLGSYLGRYQIERLMEHLTQGYLRALGEEDPERRAQIWQLLGESEKTLNEQFRRFVAEFARVEAAEARVSKFALALPYADRLFPFATFDLRQALEIHARGIAQAVENRLDQPLKARAYTLSAELFLMQHTCHWFCRSKAVASARMLARHQTSYAQLVDAVSPETREAYRRLVGR